MQDLAAYRVKDDWKRTLIFWLSAIGETLTRRRLSALLRHGFAGRRLIVQGRDHLPQSGVFILAANHFLGGATLGSIGALLAAADQGRPDLHEEYLIVAGYRRLPPVQRCPWVARPLRWVARAFLGCWAAHLIHVPVDSPRPAIRSLREWRRRGQQQPTVVFPEAQAGLQFGEVRPGSGRWLANFPVPTVPVGVWWHEGAWQVRFGRPLRWSHRSELHDVQLGLSIAALLPSDLAPSWQWDLRRWREAHSQEGARATWSAPVSTEVSH